MRYRWQRLAPVAAATAAVLIALPASAGSSAGQPVKDNSILCGMATKPTDTTSGSSSIDHPTGLSSQGKEYQYNGGNCEANNGNSTGNYTWTLSHSNVNLTNERGTEHGLAAQTHLAQSGQVPVGFDGQVTNYDFNEAGDPCGNRTIYYASGHQFDSGTCSASGPGNFNTHGGAATGNHYRGQYGTVIYQYGNMTNSPCPTGSSNYCFEAILEGQTN